MRHRGTTLVEMSVAIAASAILVLAAGVVLVDSQAGYNNMFSRVNGEAVVGAMRAKAAFDSAARQASARQAEIEDTQITLYSYEDPETSTELDRYTRMYLSEGRLLADYGSCDAESHSLEHTVILAEGVTDIYFREAGAAVQMVMVIESDGDSRTVMSTALRHNE